MPPSSYSLSPGSSGFNEPVVAEQYKDVVGVDELAGQKCSFSKGNQCLCYEEGRGSGQRQGYYNKFNKATTANKI